MEKSEENKGEKRRIGKNKRESDVNKGEKGRGREKKRDSREKQM